MTRRSNCLILHLENVAFEASGHEGARRKFVLQGAHVEEGLIGADLAGKLRALDTAVYMLDFDGISRATLERMKDDEAGAVGAKSLRHVDPRGEHELARIAADIGVIDDSAIGATSLVTHMNSVRSLLHLKVADRRRIGSPALVSDDEGNRPYRLLAADADIAKLTILKFDRERARAQHTAFLVGLLGTVQRDAQWRAVLHHRSSPFLLALAMAHRQRDTCKPTPQRRAQPSPCRVSAAGRYSHPTQPAYPTSSKSSSK